jgi:hypothetical protein
MTKKKAIDRHGELTAAFQKHQFLKKPYLELQRDRILFVVDVVLVDVLDDELLSLRFSIQKNSNIH